MLSQAHAKARASRDRKHKDFSAFVLAHFVSYGILFHRGAIPVQGSERQYIVEHLAVGFTVLERIFAVASIRWIERQSTTVQDATYLASSRASSARESSYAATDTVVAGAVRHHDIGCVSKECLGDFLLVEISGPPTTGQQAPHTKQDAIKLDEEAVKTLTGRLSRFTRKNGQYAEKIEVLTLHGIGKRLILLSHHAVAPLSHRVVAPQMVQATELTTFKLAFAPSMTAAIVQYVELGWLLKQRFEELVDAENDLMAMEDAREGESTIRD
ncbi:hypothetical protein BC832DRAFT_594863 [Gaertneriomyces semiglobifer]|nr:hypothetical protein BC832DRAFT_594863 [Gaertneriomyces semiglobifer]